MIKSKEINTNQLAEGMIVKNYKQMCELLEQEPSDGNSKKYQIKTWERYFDYYKDGQKFVITQIYDTPLPKNDGRKLRDSLYTKYIEVLLMRYLTSGSGCSMDITKRQLYKLIGLIPNTYENYSDEFGKKVQNGMKNKCQQDIDEESIQIFCQKTNLKLNSIITSALESMKRRMLITYQTQYVVMEQGLKSHVATKEEVADILEIQNSTLREMGFDFVSDVIARNKQKEFYHNCNQKFAQYNWRGVYQQLHIIYAPDAMKKTVPTVVAKLKQLSSYQNVELLNQEFANGLYRQINKKTEEHEFGTKEKTLYTDEFAGIQKRLVDYLIRLNETEIKLVAERIDHGITSKEET